MNGYSLNHSYQSCARVARESSSSFYYAFFLLSRAKRRSMCALYAWLRRTDDLGDNHRPLDERRRDLACWRETLECTLRGEPNEELPILPALADTVARYEIPHRYLFDVIDGVATDLGEVRFATFDDLRPYCYRVASAVGLACIHIWGFRDRAALAPATSCGIAFQLTNILRDLKQDAALGRVYVPEEDLQQVRYSAEELLHGVQNERFQHLIDLQIDRAEQFYREGAELEKYLRPDGRRVFGAMYSTYYRLLREIDSRRDELLRGEVHLSPWRRACVAARWLLLPASLDARWTDQGAAR